MGATGRLRGVSRGLSEGDDRLHSRDSKADAATCGAGEDTVKADRRDIVTPDCEHVKVGGQH
jgi:hypothetical protein